MLLSEYMSHEASKINNEDIWGERKEKEQPTGKEILDKAIEEVEKKIAEEKKKKETEGMWEGVEKGIINKKFDEILSTEAQKLKDKRGNEEREKTAKSLDWEKMAEEAKKKEAEEKKGYFE